MRRLLITTALASIVTVVTFAGASQDGPRRYCAKGPNTFYVVPDGIACPPADAPRPPPKVVNWPPPMVTPKADRERPKVIDRMEPRP